ncbi:tRNA uridine-5-carboxymethylaminomethyl(34) synthesis GTPase MnmE [Ureaplasma urealyticum]|uniref:tRNA uridine-5-carboxymethylaminomethyl(34) synthesis GTPase MnmE n=1 Tax=Ureaplasma urealyticum TaxID=2130 RepID=UPI001F3DCA35|nr:tRNA uridine-5-carboxymethylaminomethyl(34) synthesis GTPase MnmE [Ureaplasma urealyticum]UIU15091.1 tRNA uridine-5-carboxymethylaminomethyl(34) synthesis GTPase MnmE [Ureaplasma urealyticum]
MSTIVALATAPMNCAIHIIRISGPQAFEMINKISTTKIKKETFKIWYTTLKDNDQVLDEVLVNTFVGPKTFTGEDLVEINCHGGVIVANLIIKILIKYGCQPAQRGEFSRRALLNKKMDLSKIEAINNLVNAKNELSVKGVIGALLGRVSQSISDFKHELFMIIGQIEVNIDYPEYDDVEQVDAINLKQRLLVLNEKIKKIIDQSKKFLPINKGIKVLIIGKPNVGKSTLLNALSNEQKAIVTDIPGTTRDVIESSINIDNITLNILDTAGIHSTNDFVENLGINKAKELINKVDLVLYLVPANNQQDLELYDLIKDQKHLLVYTKKDLIDQYSDDQIYINAKDNDIQALIDKIKELFYVQEFDNANIDVLQSQRQIGILENVNYLIDNAITNLEKGDTVDLVVADLEFCNLRLNELLGIGSEYDFLDDLFKNFCVGK